MNLKIGMTKDGRVWMTVPVMIEGKNTEIMLNFDPQEASNLGESLLKAAQYAREENRIIIPHARMEQ